MEKPVRVRFAPSPTGPLHIGGVRTALYNYLLAKKTGGVFILRIEDTDQNRFVPGAEKYIMESLKWCGISPDEGPEQGGPFQPYKQSERKSIYRDYAMQLIEKGHAYYAFDTPEELEAMRTRLEAAKVPSPQYNSISRMQMKNSLTLPEEEVKEKLKAGLPYVIRLKIPRKEEIRLKDNIRGWVMVNSSTLDDKVLMKSDGMPTYHLANVVDDHIMQISHVIRGEEWLPSAPHHVLMYTFFGWEDTMPSFAHLPLLLKPEGKGKLSKRDAEQHGFPLFPLEWKDPETGDVSKGFREEGYLPEALINFLALLGWNPGTPQELFTKEELIQSFSLERIGKSGAKFDIQKAKWYNQCYLKQKNNQELAAYLVEDLKKIGIVVSTDKAVKLCELVKDRVYFAKDLMAETLFFFQSPDSSDLKIVKDKWDNDLQLIVSEFKEEILKMESFRAESIKKGLQAILDKKDIKIGKVLQPIRVILTGKTSGPDLMLVIQEIGREDVVLRLDRALKELV